MSHLEAEDEKQWVTVADMSQTISLVVLVGSDLTEIGCRFRSLLILIENYVILFYSTDH